MIKNIVSLLFILWLFTATDGCGGFVTRLLHTRQMMFLGGISFEIYLLHMFFIPSVRHAFVAVGYPSRGLLCMLVSAVVTIVASYLVKKCYVDPVFSRFKNLIPA